MTDQADVWWDEYSRLPDGSWGVWLRSIPKDGDIVEVTLWDRTVVREKIKHVLWRDEGGAFCAIEPWTRADGVLRGRCGLCNSVRLWAFYPRYERQLILVEIVDGIARYEYTGEVATSDSDPAPGESFSCSTCGMTAPSIEHLVGIGDENAWVGPKGITGDYYAMGCIQRILEDRHWTLDTVKEIARIVEATGREIPLRKEPT